ncbi:MAG TPA: sulfotransferase [Rhizomicrobium sp.]
MASSIDIRSPPSGVSPIVVFGTGGSGTRAVAAFLSACGIDMGRKVNGAGDALAFTSVLRAHIDGLIATTRRLDYDVAQIDAAISAAVVADYRRAAELHREGRQQHSARWGFKNPRNIFTLPLIDMAFPDALFVHVLRDGRDMILSHNRNQPERHFEALFGRPFDQTEADVGRFWAKSNLEARAFGTGRLGRRYIPARIEDLCGPDRVAGVVAFAVSIGIDPHIAARHAEIFEPQNSFGRGTRTSVGEEVGEMFRAALSTFDYR